MPDPDTPPTADGAAARELASVRDLLRNVLGVLQHSLRDIDDAIAKPPPDEPPKPPKDVAEKPPPEDPPKPPKDELGAVRELVSKLLATLHEALHGLEETVSGEPTKPATPAAPPAGETGASTPPTPTATPTGGAVPAGEVAGPVAPIPPSTPSTPASEAGGAIPPVASTEPTEPATPLPTPPTTEPKMPIGTKNFAFAHARIESDGENVRVIRSTGFTPAITHPGDSDPAHCAPPDDLPKVAKVKPEDAGKLPPNTLLYRLLLPTNHQIDKKEAVVTATGANRETHSHYRTSAWAVNDRTVEVAVEIREPDVNAEAKEVFALDVIVFRVD